MIIKGPVRRRIESGPLFLLKLTDEGANFILLSLPDASERHPECFSLDPPDSRFIDHDRPIDVWNMETAFKLVSLAHNCFALDLASADR